MITHYKNGRCYTLEQGNPWVEEFFTENGKIIALGSQTIQADRVVDLQGYTLFPGWVDAHLHIAGYGERLTLPNLHKLHEKTIVIEHIRRAFKHEPLYIQGYHECGLTKEDLDSISATHPILVRHADYHSATVNSVLLHSIGLPQSTGVLHELDAQQAVFAMPRHSQKTLQTMIANAIHSLHSYGITGGHSDDLHYFNGFTDTVEAFERALHEHPFRAHLLIHHQEVDGFVKSGRPWLDQSPFLQLGAVKIFYDGTLSSQTAWMAHPYPNGSLGERIMTTEEFEHTLLKMRRLNLPVALHTIGDLALDEVGHWLKKYPVQKGLHDRIIHASFAQLSSLPLLQSLPIILDIQPQFLSSDLPWGLKLLPSQTELIYAWKTYLKNGLVLCGGSDAPVEVPDPLKAIRAAVKRISDQDGQSYGEVEKLTMLEAIHLYTTQANVPTYKTYERGKLAKGYVADFTVFNVDFLNDPALLDQAYVTMTIVDDQLVYLKD
jgi:hypothetical protein